MCFLSVKTVFFYILFVTLQRFLHETFDSNYTIQ